MKLSELKPAPGAQHRRKIVGRGRGSGHGATATRGTKGQNARKGPGPRIGFEGGQMPLIRRIPKRGFNHSAFTRSFAILNLELLGSKFKQGEEVNPHILKERGLIKGNLPIKILGNGELGFALTVKAHAFSESSKSKILATGGKVEVLKY